MTSIPPPHAVTVTHGGWLNAPDLWIWAGYGLVALLAALSMPTGLRESAIALFAPILRFLRALHAPLAAGWWGWMVLCFLEPLRVLENIVLDFLWKTIGKEQPVRLGFLGFIPPETT